MFGGQAPSLQLIDFGKSIDLRLLPKGILFNKVTRLFLLIGDWVERVLFQLLFFSALYSCGSQMEELLPNGGVSSGWVCYQRAYPPVQFCNTVSYVARHQVCKTDGLLCPEMREGRGWREHLDYFGLAATAYLLLFSTYMDIVQVSRAGINKNCS